MSSDLRTAFQALDKLVEQVPAEPTTTFPAKSSAVVADVQMSPLGSRRVGSAWEDRG
jgi:hypothetical protein